MAGDIKETKATTQFNHLQDKIAELQGELTEQKSQSNMGKETLDSFRLLVENVKDYAIFMLDRNGNVATWNAGAERINGYRADEIIGRHFSTFYPPEDLAWNKPAWELEEAIRDGRFEDEGWRVRKDGSRLWANVVITALFDEKRELKGFAKVTRDVTERKQAEETIRRMNAELEQRVKERTAELEAANAEKDLLLKREQEARELAEKAVKDREDFLSIAAHELKTPITSLHGYAQLLKRQLQKKGELDPARLHHTIEVFESQTDKLNRLTQRLLDISRYQSGRLVLEQENADLVKLVKNIAEILQSKTDRHPISYQGPDTLVAWIDPLRVEQVVTNLVENAIKYSPEGGPIELSLKQVGPDSVTLTVQDRGIGIGSGDLERIFEPFYQGHQAAFAGLGLGLYITRRIVEMHGGKIEAQSPPEGGTAFLVGLPVHASEQV